MVNQTDYNKNNGALIFGKLGVDYFLSNKTTISLAGIKVHGDFKPGDVLDIYTDSLYNSGTTSNYSQRLSNSSCEFNGGGLVMLPAHRGELYGVGLPSTTATLNYQKISVPN